MKKLIAIAVVLVLSFSLIPAALVGADPGPGITGLWHFEEGSGTTAYDSSGNNNDGTLTNGPIWVDGKFGKALSFDGVDDYVNISDDPSLNMGDSTDFTLEAWVKGNKDQHGVVGVVISKSKLSPDAQYQMTIWNVSGVPYLWLDELDKPFLRLEATSDVLDGEWHYIAITVDRDNPSGAKIYVDGGLENTGDPTAVGDVSNDEPLTIGEWTPSLGMYPFNGLIDEVRIWDEALTASQIALSYSGSVNWLPPVTNADFELKDGTTLPLKFQLFDNSGLVCSEQPVSLEVTGPSSFTSIIFQLGEGVENLRWNADECYYIANLKTKVGYWPTGTYTATMGGIVTGAIDFYLSADKGVGRGNSGK